MVNSNPSSPAHFGLAGNFSADDIHELLGAMTEDNQSRATGIASSVASSAGAIEEGKGDDVEDGTKANARSERKRSREKQRRCDVNKQFSDLTQVLREIEGAKDDSRLSFSPANRVDLVSRTINHLEHLRDANKRQKTEIDTLKQQLDQTKKAGEDTAAKLKEAMFNQPPQNKQVCYMLLNESLG
jgi:hypothetical protein